MKKKYVLYKDSVSKKIVKFEHKLKGYELKPRNNVRQMSKVDSVMIVNPSFIEKVLKRKIKKKLDYYLQYIINMLDNEEDDGTNLSEALNDLTRYKSIIEYKYRKYLDEKYINLLLKKINLLEHELKMKIVYKATYEYEYEEELTERKGKSR